MSWKETVLLYAPYVMADLVELETSELLNDDEFPEGSFPFCNPPAPPKAVLGYGVFNSCLDVILAEIPPIHIQMFLLLVSLLDGSIHREFSKEEMVISNRFLQLFLKTIQDEREGKQSMMFIQEIYLELCPTLLLGAHIFPETLVDEHFTQFLTAYVEHLGLTGHYETLCKELNPD